MFTFLPAQSVTALTYEVNTTTDTTDGTCDSTHCSLREAITAANASTGPDTIRFAIGSGTATIALTSALPTIVDPLNIDGTTQPGFTSTPLIELTGNGLGAGVNGLYFSTGSDNSSVRGLVINSFSGAGIFIENTSGLTITGNYLGINAAGTAAQLNLNGIRINAAHNNVIGGTTAADRNILSGNAASGLLIQSATGNVVQGNYLGTDVTGTASVGNLFGVFITGVGSSTNTIGGTTAGAGNLISGNNRGLLITNNSSSNVVQGNFIGTNAAGTAALPNSIGVHFQGTASSNSVGGTDVGAGNLISGNGTGVVFANLGGVNNLVQGNFIGTGSGGIGSVPNTGAGIEILGTTSGSTIGGTAPGAGNVIRGNGGDGVQVLSPSGANPIRGNQISANGDLGIDLNNDGVTANDSGDGDTGANSLQNFPTLPQVVNNAGVTTLTGTLNSSASATFELDFYSQASCDASGYGEGETYLGSVTITTDEFGDAAFSFDAGDLADGTIITSTATNAANETSEFSPCVSVSKGVLVVTTAADTDDGTCDADCSLREALTTANAAGGAQLIRFAIGSGAATISPTSALPTITGMVTIDGTSQPGYVGTPLIELTGTGAGAGASGLHFSAGSDGSVIRGLVINGFTGSGVFVENANGLTITGIIIGTNAAGTAALPNGGAGIWLDQSNNNIVGGTSASVRNLISGNSGSAISITSGSGTVIQGNYIGTDVTGMMSIPNGGHGIGITGSGTGNIIGVNLIGTQGGLGIDLNDDGVTPNDSGDTDSGPNSLQNFPVITSAIWTPQGTTIGGTLNSSANTTFTLNFYFQGACDASGYGEGKSYLHTVRVTTDGDGNGTFSFNTDSLIGTVITATATNAASGTSEFSPCATVTTTTLTVTKTADTNDGVCDADCSLREAITVANVAIGPQTINFAIGTGAKIISPASALPDITGPVTIDGTTQPGFSTLPLIELNGANAGAGVNGLLIRASDSTVRSLVINRFKASGIFVVTTANNTTITGNVIGTDNAGSYNLGNGGFGIRTQSSYNRIGGITAVELNLIAGNLSGGLSFQNSIGSVIQGNILGTNRAGTKFISNNGHGIVFSGGSGNTVGGTAEGAGNVITGSSGSGLLIWQNANNNLVQGNTISSGITIDANSTGNTIGGITTGAGNAISGEVSIMSGSNLVRGNRISAGIDLNNDGFTLNDSGDGDTGPNSLQNFPIIIGADDDAGVLTLTGTLNSSANETFTLDFYACGASYLGSTSVTTDSSGNASFMLVVNNSVVALLVSATATNSHNETSEYASVCSVVTFTTLTVNDTYSDGICNVRCSLYDAITTANDTDIDEVINFNFTGPGPHVISLDRTPPTITDTVTINGLSEPDISGGVCPLPNGALAVQFRYYDPWEPRRSGGLTLGGGSSGSTIRGLSLTNFTYGIRIINSGNHTITCNNIGVAADGTTAGGNYDGLRLDTVDNIVIGGSTPGTLNVIAHNTQDGIMFMDVSNSTVLGNIIRNNGGYFGQGGLNFWETRNFGVRISQNSIYGNVKLGIDLNQNGVTLNDPGDIDTGSNGLQNFPVITRAFNSGGATTISGSLNSSANKTFSLEFFSQSACDSFGYGQGETYLGTVEVTTDDSGNASFTIDVGHLSPGTVITSTATDLAANNTSEFSACATVVPGVTISTTDAVGAETDANQITFRISRGGSTAADLSVSYTVGGSATAATDYTPALTGSVVIPAGQAFVDLTITPVNDAVDEVDESVILTITDMAAYDPAVTAEATGTISDDDMAGITVSPISGLVTTEAGGTAQFTLVLTSQPTADVTIGLTSSNTTEGTLSASSIVFTSANWATPQTVTISGVDDLLDDGSIGYQIVTEATSTDASYNGLNTDDVSVTNEDDDLQTATVQFSSSGARTPDETGTTYNVEVTLTTSDGGPLLNAITVDVSDLGTGSATATADYNFSPTTLTFAASAASGSTQTAIIAVVEDGDIEADETVELSLVNLSGTNATLGAQPGYSFTIADDDTPQSASVAFNPAGASTPDETGTSYTVDVTLTTSDGRPLVNPITVDVFDLGTGSATTGVDYNFSTTTLTFAASAASGSTQTATIAVVSDSDDESNETVEFTLVNLTGTNASLGSQTGYTLTITDDEAAPIPGVTVTPTRLRIRVGQANTYTVVLNTQPTRDVTISLTQPQGCTVRPRTLTFTPANWNTPQTVRVRAGTTRGVRCVIRHTATGGGYRGVTIQNVVVTIP